MEEVFTYRQDEILIIFQNCCSLSELDKAASTIGYLNVLGVQAYRPVIAKLRRKREDQLNFKNKKR